MSLASEAIEYLDPDVVDAADNAFEQLRQKLPDTEVRALAQEVILRLADRHDAPARSAQRPGPAEIEILSRALVSHSPDAALDRILEAIRGGASIETIYLDHLTSAARRLGEYWDSDEASFAEVTVGISRIYTIMRRLVSSRLGSVTPRHRTAVVATLPGEQHSLGAQMATDLARLDGWDIRMCSDLSHDEILEQVSAPDVAVIGITAARIECLGALARLIASIRIVAPSVRILISGRMAEAERKAVDWMGADALAATLPEAIAELERLYDEAAAARSKA